MSRVRQNLPLIVHAMPAKQPPTDAPPGLPKLSPEERIRQAYGIAKSRSLHFTILAGSLLVVWLSIESQFNKVDAIFSELQRPQPSLDRLPMLALEAPRVFGQLKSSPPQAGQTKSTEPVTEVTPAPTAPDDLPAVGQRLPNHPYDEMLLAAIAAVSGQSERRTPEGTILALKAMLQEAVEIELIPGTKMKIEMLHAAIAWLLISFGLVFVIDATRASTAKQIYRALADLRTVNNDRQPFPDLFGDAPFWMAPLPAPPTHMRNVGRADLLQVLGWNEDYRRNCAFSILGMLVLALISLRVGHIGAMTGLMARAIDRNTWFGMAIWVGSLILAGAMSGFVVWSAVNISRWTRSADPIAPQRPFSKRLISLWRRVRATPRAHALDLGRREFSWVALGGVSFITLYPFISPRGGEIVWDNTRRFLDAVLKRAPRFRKKPVTQALSYELENGFYRHRTHKRRDGMDVIHYYLSFGRLVGATPDLPHASNLVALTSDPAPSDLQRSTLSASVADRAGALVQLGRNEAAVDLIAAALEMGPAKRENESFAPDLRLFDLGAGLATRYKLATHREQLIALLANQGAKKYSKGLDEAIGARLESWRKADSRFQRRWLSQDGFKWGTIAIHALGS